MLQQTYELGVTCDLRIIKTEKEWLIYRNFCFIFLLLIGHQN